MAAIGSRPLLLGPVLLGLAALAWSSLAWWESSSSAHTLHLPALATAGLACASPAPPAQAGLYVAGWLLMTIAMMLPTTLPVANVFARLTQRRRDRARLLALLVAGYLLAWLAFGVVAHLAHLLAAAWLDQRPWTWSHAWVVPAATLALAGAFQFSRLKARCLDACRSPLPFVASRWQGAAPAREAFRIGIDHGVFCVGCCWALMLLMFTVGVGSLAWMLVLAGLMAIEKNATWGRRLGPPLGMVLLVLSAVVAWTNLAVAGG
jgi:predicted metal-binding membrane protein